MIGIYAFNGRTIFISVSGDLYPDIAFVTCLCCLCYNVLNITLPCFAYRPTAVNSIADGRQTKCMTVAVYIADGRQTITFGL